MNDILGPPDEGGLTVEIGQPGFWLARHSDWSGIAAFPTEIEALRYAVSQSMTVQFQEWGEVR